MAKLERNIGGIKDMRKLPGALFIVDPSSEKIAVAEAKVLGIPVVAITDTNCDPTNIDYVVPGNDDAMKSIKLFLEYFSNSILEGASSRPKKKGGDKPSQDKILEKEMMAKMKKSEAN